MNDLETVIDGNDNDQISFYLENVSVADFKNHVKEIRAKYSNQEGIKKAINQLQQLLNS